MKAIKIALLWHYHQPYYKKDDEFLLPWVRLHGVKDYWDIPELFHEFPKIKQTINLVPSLSKQIEEYVSGKTKDKVQRLTEIKAKELNLNDKNEILRLFFLCNVDNMIKPYPKYYELYILSRDKEKALNNFDPQDWLDIQVWYNLTWFGPSSRKRPVINRLFEKGKDFNEQEKKVVLELHLEILNQIKHQLMMLKSLDQVELSATPLNHPILPLLCNSKSALESIPDCDMPEKIFEHPEDAQAQINKALDYYESNFNYRPTGMWPSEGSISDEVLNLMIGSSVNWVASDEEVLANTLKEKYNPFMKYFPVKYKSDKGEISIFFRDHQLSDLIGFVYSRWNQKDAANDFCNRLRQIRGDIIDKFGEESLDEAVVPIILDGENCWEFYHENGIHFLRELFAILSDSDDMKTVTFSEASNCRSNKFHSINHIQAGSWINANFKIWIGHQEELKAWTMLANARDIVSKSKEKVNIDTFNKAMEEIYIAEGSDWFWWYGDEHIAENKNDFDIMFRWHIAKIYKILDLDVPEIVKMPISQQFEKQSIVKQRGEVLPIIDGKISDSEKWNDAGYFDASASMSAMHQIGEILHRVWYAKSQGKIIFRCDTTQNLKNGQRIEFNFLKPLNFEFIIKSTGILIKCRSTDVHLSYFEYAKEDIIEFAFPESIFQDGSNKIELTIKTITSNSEIVYPRQGVLELDFD